MKKDEVFKQKTVVSRQTQCRKIFPGWIGAGKQLIVGPGRREKS